MDQKQVLQCGCVDIWIDTITPCLIDTVTNKKEETVVFKIESRSYLKQFTVKNGWNIDWVKLSKDVECYALALRGNNEIQGLIAIKNDINADAVYLHYASTAPHNDKHRHGFQRYSGVGGHLFAIAAEKSIEWHHGGSLYGFAADKKLLDHYVETFGAIRVGILHPYHFWIPEERSEKIMEVYNYEWK